MTVKETNNKVVDLKAKNSTMNYTWTALGLAGGVLGVIYAIKTKKSFWGKVGFYFLGTAIVSIPAGMVMYPKIAKNKAEIEKTNSSLTKPM